MAKRLLVLALVTVGLVLALQAADKRTTQGDLVYLQNGSNLRISIETYRARDGWTPVIVSVAGAEVSAVMDSKGRVVHEWAKGLDKHSIPLFTIELDKGRVMLAREAHGVQVFEQNNMRTRFEIAESVIQLPVRMDRTGKNGRLRFGGLEIPAQVGEVDHAAQSRVINPAGAKPGLTGIRLMGLPAIRPAGVASASPIARGFGAKAQLVASRLRARGK